MKKHILIAIALVVAVVLPLAAATKGTKRAASTAVKAPVTENTGNMEEEVTEKPTIDKPAVARKSVSSGSAKKKPAATPADIEIRRVPAKQSRARQLVADLSESQQSKLLAFLNEADVKQLGEIRGVSTVRGAAIEQARPFAVIDEVILVAGVGEGTFGEIVKHGKTLTLAQATAAVGKSKSTSARKSS